MADGTKRGEFCDGLYEELVSVGLRERLSGLGADQQYSEEVDAAEIPSVFSEYVAGIVRDGLSVLGESGAERSEQLKLANDVIALVARRTAAAVPAEERADDAAAYRERIDDGSELLRAVLADPAASAVGRKASGLPRPATSIASSSLFTGAPREPSLASELKKEIASSDSIDIVVSFIRWSGVRLLLDELKAFTDAGKRLRIITTTYMGATELRAVVELAKLYNTELRVSFDSERTRLHAKAYIFRRNTGFSTAYVGSSNLTNPAMTSGCEWNVKFSKAEQPSLFEKVEASFEAYWNAVDFERYTPEKYEALRSELERQSRKLSGAGAGSGTAGGVRRPYQFDLHPYAYQEAILDRLETERVVNGSYRNLVVAATGTGKTMIAAFDYKRQCERAGRRLPLLFAAHRREILEQSAETFRAVLRDPNFGDLLVGNYKPTQQQFLFVSVDMLNQRDFTSLPADTYEYVVLDECHHAAAKSYQSFLTHFTPKFLLGLTATPERMDGVSVVANFNDRIAAEIGLDDAINRKLLCPFEYFCVEDTADLSELRWSRGGYERSALEDVFVLNREAALRRAAMILRSVERYVGDPETMKGLVFCVSVRHAEFMAEFFNSHGIAARALSGASTDAERSRVRGELASGRTKLVCVVDLYNEGVDIREINTVLFLRPTESRTIFLQQLGRGLRLAEGKQSLTVLDFIGRANTKYSYENKFKALLGRRGGASVLRELKDGFPHLPKGCYIQLEKKAKEHILENLNAASSKRKSLIQKIRGFADDADMPLTPANFFSFHQLEPRTLYGQKLTITDVTAPPTAPDADKEMWKKLYHVATLDSLDCLRFLAERLGKLGGGGVDADAPEFAALSERERGFLAVAYRCFLAERPESFRDLVLRLRDYLAANREYQPEILGLVAYRRDTVDFIAMKNNMPFENALDVYCTYTRAQALAALDFWKTSSEGVTRVRERKTTCLFVTLNKSHNYYSPTTAYHDYSISPTLFHWQSQNATSEYTPVGQRYIHAEEQGETILLFVREAKDDDAGSVPFEFLGRAFYVSHSGNRPMSITWRLEHPIPARFIEVTDKLGVA